MSQSRSWRYVVHKLDMYAKPVTLTYNGERNVTTVPGVVCTLISLILIAFQMSTTFMKYADHRYVNYTRNNKQLLVKTTDTNPISYTINTELFNVLTQINSTNTTYQQNLDAYYSGVYLQVSYSKGESSANFQYINPVPCPQMYANSQI